MATGGAQVGHIMELLTSAGQAGSPLAQAAPAGATSGDEDAAGQRSRKRAASGRPQDERLAAVQEKNRKAQKRFRERQKEKMSTMEAEIADKDRQLTALREENSSLAGRNAVLEKVLALREEQLKQQQGGAADTNQLAVLGYTPLAAGGAATSAGLLPPTSAQPSMLPPAAGLLTGGSNPGGGADKQGPNQQWMEYVNELSKLTEDKASPTSERRLSQIVSQAAQLSARNAPFASPTNGAARDAGNVDPARWKSIAANMGVSPEQRAEVKRLRDAHLQRLQNLQVARHQLTANVTTASAKPNNTAQMEAATTELSNSLQEESEANSQILQDIYTKVLTPKQFGKAVVQSYPFYLDGTVLVELLATDGQTQNHVPPIPLPPGIGANSLFANLAVSQPELLASLAAGMPVMQSGALAPAATPKAAGSS